MANCRVGGGGGLINRSAKFGKIFWKILELGKGIAEIAKMSYFGKLENMLDIKKSDEKKLVEKKNRLKVAVG